MVGNYVAAVGEDLEIDLGRPVLSTLFEEYERVLVQSLVSAFGLDFLVTDRHGGDVDTVHNVRRIGSDPDMSYKNRANERAYEARGGYNSYEYHHHPGYIEKNRQISRQKKDGTLTDAYTGDRIAPNGRTDLDHVMSAYEIHNDRGRVLAGLRGEDLANNPDNLQATNQHTNRSKKQQSMQDYLAKHPGEYTKAQQDNMMSKDRRARKAVDAAINRAYYTSHAFRQDVAAAAGKTGLGMGVRQAVGLVFAELWFAVKDEFRSAKQCFGEWLEAIGTGMQKGFEQVQDKYRDFFSAFFRGAAGGILASIVTTLCNIFFTTGKTVVKCIREAWVSITETVRILLINPDDYLLGDRLRAALKSLATGASIIVGVLAEEAVTKIGFQAVPELGSIVPSFVGVFTSGILSCTLLYVLDRSVLVNQCAAWLNAAPTVERDIRYFRSQARKFQQYAAELADLDLAQFQSEVRFYSRLSGRLQKAGSEEELNRALLKQLSDAHISLPWAGDFDDFMGKKENKLRFP